MAKERKILGTTTSCEGCPNRVYESSGRYQCKLVDEVILEARQVASFCPLPDYPSRTLAQQEATIHFLRQQDKNNLTFTVLSHVSSKFNVLLSAEGVVCLALEKGEVANLRFDNITEITPRLDQIHFTSSGVNFKIHIGGEGALLFKEVIGFGEPLWTECEVNHS